MPTITVSQDVLDRLRALRQAGEDTEDAVLRRVLGQAETEAERRLRVYERAERDIDSTN